MSTVVPGRPLIVLPGLPTTVEAGPVIAQMLRRASSPSFGSWWHRVESVGFCAHPIQLSGADTGGHTHTVWTRCNNRRAVVCPSCSDLYARDTWQLVHAGAAGGHHDVPVEVAARPQVFATLTAPSYGAVHNATGTPCRTRNGASSATRCLHGNELRCNITHQVDDPMVGQPLCRDCYDYLGHVLFTWHLPELWRRFTIALRRAVATHLKTVGVTPGSVRISFVKVTELQARAIPHIHALIRLDPPPGHITKSGDHDRYGPAAPWGGGEHRTVADQQTDWSSPITAAELAALIQRAARHVCIDIATGDGGPDQQAVWALRFGTQIDTQPLTPETPIAAIDSEADDTACMTVSRLSPRRVAAYLAKYVTKSLHDFGITARRLTAEAIGDLEVTEHVRAILATLAQLAAEHTASASPSLAGIGRWLHTLGYRGHITTKSRHYSTTMGALRAARATWTRHQIAKHSGHQDDTQSFDRSMTADRQHDEQVDTDQVLWEFDGAGHTSAGDRVLVISAAMRHIGARITGITESRTVTTCIPPHRSGGNSSPSPRSTMGSPGRHDD